MAPGRPAPPPFARPAPEGPPLEDLELLRNIAIALALALTGGLAARAVRVPTIVGYLLAGAVISPFTPGYDADVDTLRAIAQLGVIFLMFGVGLQFNLRDLLSVKMIAVPGATLHIILSVSLGTGIGLLFGLPNREAIVLGLALGNASTIVLARLLDGWGLLESIGGRVAIAWVIVCDLGSVLFLVLLPALAPDGNGSVVQEAGLAIAKAAVFIALMLFAGSRLVPWILLLVARTGSRELFILTVVAGALGIATGAAAFGLSIALGAFIAGLVVSESDTSHQAAADVLPLREAFAVLFFVSVGMILDPVVVREHLGLFIAVLLAVLVGNALIAGTIAACFRFPGRVAITVAAGIAQIGEFSFIIADQALNLDLVGLATYNVILAVAVVSITLNPLAFATMRHLERFLQSHVGPLWRLIDRQGPIPGPQVPTSGHGVIVGYGRVGELIGHALSQVGLPYGVVEADIGTARRLNAAGIPTIWGDGAAPEVLKMASLEGARLVVLAVPDEGTTLLAIANIRRVNPAVAIIVRAHRAADAVAMRELGANEIVVPAYEGGLEMMRQSLLSLGYATEEVLHYAQAVRDIHYNDPAHRHIVV